MERPKSPPSNETAPALEEPAAVPAPPAPVTLVAPDVPTKPAEAMAKPAEDRPEPAAAMTRPDAPPAATATAPPKPEGSAPLTRTDAATGEELRTLLLRRLADKAAAAPALKPEILALTLVGGKGDQWLQEVGFTSDGRVFGKSGTDAKTAPRGFTVYYSAEGKFLNVEGDVNLPSGGLRGERWANGGTSVRDPATGVTLEIGYKQVARLLQQPFLRSSAGWKWWGWGAGQAETYKLMADSRGVRVYLAPGGLFLAKCWTDGGNTTLARHPMDLAHGNRFTKDGFVKGGKGSIYMLGDVKTGTPLVGTWAGFRPQAEAVDAWGRVYSCELGRTAGTPDDRFKLGGDGVYVLDPLLSKRLFLGSLGMDRVLCMAIKDNILVVGGSTGGAKSAADPAVLRVTNPAQPAPGGGEDGVLAVIKLW